MASAAKSTSGKILHNSFWYGLETALETIIFFGTSIAIARYFGPQKMGYFSYINFFVITITRTSGTGLAGATRKYMSEFLALDKPGTAHAVYHLAYRYQLLGAICISVLGVAGVVLFGEPGYKIMSCILILAIAPGVMSWVPAQANNAFEDVAPNTRSALGYLVSYAFVIFLTLFFHWNLIGIASATFIGRCVEVILRTIPLNRKLRRLPLDVLPDEVVQRIRRYCVQAIGVQLLMSVVWDRSELFFLRRLSTLEQISFYSISFGFANNLLLFPRTFGPATGYTLMVEASSDPSRVDSIVKNACRFLLFVALPVHLGAAAIARGAISVAYDSRYIAAIPVLIIAAILSIPRAFQELSEVLMRAADRQKELLTWLTITGAVNIILDYFLIRHYGAIGAAWANGLAQSLGIMVIWQQARRFYNFSFPVASAIRISAAALIMAAIAWSIDHAVHGLPGLILAIAVAVPTYLLLIKLFRGLEPYDRTRLAPIGNNLPGPARRLYLATVEFVTPAAS